MTSTAHRAAKPRRKPAVIGADGFRHVLIVPILAATASARSECWFIVRAQSDRAAHCRSNT